MVVFGADKRCREDFTVQFGKGKGLLKGRTGGGGTCTSTETVFSGIYKMLHNSLLYQYPSTNLEILPICPLYRQTSKTDQSRRISSWPLGGILTPTSKYVLQSIYIVGHFDTSTNVFFYTIL